MVSEAVKTIKETLGVLDTFKSKSKNWKVQLIKVLFPILFSLIFSVIVVLLFDQLGLLANPRVLLLKHALDSVGFSSVFSNRLFVLATLCTVTLFVVVLLTIKDKILMGRDYRWVPEKGLSDWDFQGNVGVDAEMGALHIIQSDLGCVIKGRKWRNFDMSFKFKIPREDNQLGKGFGIIYRAFQLGQYYMLKVDSIGYQPHVRNVLWENNGRLEKTTLTPSNLGEWVEANISVRDCTVSAKIGPDVFSFGIPTYSNIQRNYPEESYEKSKFENSPYDKIPFYLSGSVGFRSAPSEEVYIKDLEVRAERPFKALARLVSSWWKTR